MVALSICQLICLHPSTLASWNAFLFICFFICVPSWGPQGEFNLKKAVTDMEVFFWEYFLKQNLRLQFDNFAAQDIATKLKKEHSGCQSCPLTTEPISTILKRPLLANAGAGSSGSPLYVFTTQHQPLTTTIPLSSPSSPSLGLFLRL